MEPSARFERAAFSLPRRRSIRWSYEGVSWGRWGRTSVSRAKTSRPAISRVPIRAPTGWYPRLAVLTGNARTLVPGAQCPRRDSNAHYRSPQDRDSCRWSTRTWSLWTASNRLSSPYEGDALPGEVQRRGYRGWNRTSVPSGQSRDGMPATHPVMVRKVRFERTCREV
jgi:hypothetical protein